MSLKGTLFSAQSCLLPCRSLTDLLIFAQWTQLIAWRAECQLCCIHLVSLIPRILEIAAAQLSTFIRHWTQNNCPHSINNRAEQTLTLAAIFLVFPDSATSLLNVPRDFLSMSKAPSDHSLVTSLGIFVTNLHRAFFSPLFCRIKISIICETLC